MNYDDLLSLGYKIDNLVNSNKKIELENKIQELNSFELNNSSHMVIVYYYIANMWSALRRINHNKENHSIWEFEQKELFKEIYSLRKATLEKDFESVALEFKLYIYTNLGNAFSHYGRTINAIKYFNKALKLYSEFEMALMNKALCLDSYSRLNYDYGHRELIIKESYIYFEKACQSLYHAFKESNDEYYKNILITALSSMDKIEKVIGKEFLKEKMDLNKYELRNHKNERIYRNWVLKNNLYLNSINDLGSNTIATHDPLHLPDFTSRIDKGFPLIITHFNQIKQEYITYRHLLFEGLTSLTKKFYDKEIHIYDDYDYNLYNIDTEKIKLAFRGFYSLFDKVANFMNLYFELDLNENQVDFRKVWYIKNNLNPKFKNFENLALRGLYLISKDLYFNSKDEESKKFIEVLEPEASKINEIRNHLEHKFIMIKAENIEKDEQKPDRERCFYITKDELEEKTIYLGKLIRETIIYLSFSVHLEEQKKDKSKNYVPIDLSLIK